MPVLTKKTRRFIHDLIPPLFWQLYLRHVERTGYFGDYPTWEEARNASSGYDSQHILDQVRDALLKVKRGEAVYERDSVLFDEVQYSWPLLSGLLWIALQNDNRLNIIDFGGSLGSSYFQNRIFLEPLQELTWNIVEQNKFVECGKKYFENNQLRFYYSINDCLEEQKPDTVLLGSVLQYLGNPYEFLAQLIEKRFNFIIVDRTPFVTIGNERIAIQKVSPRIYRASYPSWIFDEKKFKEILSQKYELIAEYESCGSSDVRVKFKGFIYRAIF